MERFLKQCTRAALGVTLAAVLLAGCAGQEAGQSASAPPMSESAAQTDGAAVEQLLKGEHTLTALPTGYMDTPLTQTGQGLYEFVNLTDRYLLCYVDYAAGTRTPLCDVAGCAHADESCPAYTRNYRNVAVTGDWVLTVGSEINEDYSMDARRLDGSGKKVLFSDLGEPVPYPYGFAREGDKVWLAIKGKAVLLDPATGEMEEGAVLPESFTDVGVLGSGVLRIFSNGEELMEEHYQPTGDLEADFRQEQEIRAQSAMTLSAWDPRTGEETELMNWNEGEWRFLRVWNNKVILLNEEQGRIEARDLITGEASALVENWPEDQYIALSSLWDDHLILETTWEAEPDNSATWQECMFALDLVSGELTEITLRNHGGQGTPLSRVLGESEDKFYVVYSTPSRGEPEGTRAMISKADFYAGVDSMVAIKDVFR